MENLLLSFNVVFPMFVLLAVGFLMKKLGLLGKRLAGGINKLIFQPVYPGSGSLKILSTPTFDCLQLAAALLQHCGFHGDFRACHAHHPAYGA